MDSMYIACATAATARENDHTRCTRCGKAPRMPNWQSYGDRMKPFDWMQGHSPRWHSHSVEVGSSNLIEKGGSRLTVEPIPSAVSGFPKTHKSSSLSGGTSDSSTSRWYVSLFFGAKLQYMSADDWLAQAVCPILLSPGPFPCLERFGRSLLADTGKP